MTTETLVRRWDHDGDGVSKPFGYTNRITDAAELEVYVDGLLQPTLIGYHVTGVGADGGGEVVFDVAPPEGVKNVVIQSAVVPKQSVDLEAGESVASLTLERMVDRNTHVLQELKEHYHDRLLRIATQHWDGHSPVLPKPDPLKLLRWDATGKALESVAQLGVFKSDWATATAYGVNDIVRLPGGASTPDRLYIAVSGHTSDVFATDLAAGLWSLVIEAEPGPTGPAGMGSGDMLRSNNLSDVLDATASRASLGLGAVALLNAIGIADVTGLQAALDGKMRAQPAMGTFSRAMDGASGPQQIDGLGIAPKAVLIIGGITSNSPVLWVLATPSMIGSISNRHGGVADTWHVGLNGGFLQLTGADYQQITGITFGPDDFTLQWLKVGLPTGNSVHFYLAFGV